MSVFSDSDLAKLKEHLDLGGFADEKTGFDIKALLSRLDAAEKVCGDIEGCVCMTCAAHQILRMAWNKSAGRE